MWGNKASQLVPRNCTHAVTQHIPNSVESQIFLKNCCRQYLRAWHISLLRTRSYSFIIPQSASFPTFAVFIFSLIVEQTWPKSCTKKWFTLWAWIQKHYFDELRLSSLSLRSHLPQESDKDILIRIAAPSCRALLAALARCTCTSLFTFNHANYRFPLRFTHFRWIIRFYHFS